MKSLFFLLALGLAHAAKITSYPQPEEAAPSSYGEDSSYGKEDSYGGSSSGGYGGGGDEYAKQPKCSYYDETHYKEHCEEYYEKLCTTTHKESCKDVKDKNCNGVVSSKQVRKCFDVTELRCSLKEDVKLETVQLPVTVQKCRRRPGTSISFVLLPLVPNTSLSIHSRASVRHRVRFPHHPQGPPRLHQRREQQVQLHQADRLRPHLPLVLLHRLRDHPRLRSSPAQGRIS